MVKSWIAPGLKPSRGGAVVGVGGALPREPCRFQVRHFMPSWCAEFSVFQIVNCPWLVSFDFAYLSYILGIERFLVLTDIGAQTFCAVSEVHCWQYRRNLLWQSLFMENRKPSGAYLQCSRVWFLFTSWWIKTVCRVSRGPMEQTLTVLLAFWTGPKNKVFSFTCVRSLCCFWTFFHLTLSHDSD